MKLSIITVNFNNSDGLRKTIDSVVAQTFKDFEWIVIDGGSTDGSCELIEQYADYFSYWVSEKDKGIYHAMNKGIDRASGDYLQFLNSGDWLDSNDVLRSFFSAPIEGDILYGDQDYYFNGVLMEHRIHPDEVSLSYLYENSLGHSSSFIKRELLSAHHYNESYRIVSDWEFFLMMAMSDKVFVHRPVTVGCFEMTGISSTNTETLRLERQSVTETLFPKCLQNDFRRRDEMKSRLKVYEHQMDEQLKTVCLYRSKRKFYRKLLNLYLRTVRTIDKL